MVSALIFVIYCIAFLELLEFVQEEGIPALLLSGLLAYPAVTSIAFVSIEAGVIAGRIIFVGAAFFACIYIKYRWRQISRILKNDLVIWRILLGNSGRDSRKLFGLCNLENAVGVFALGYFAASLFAALVSPVTNWDSNTYNVARVASSVLTQEFFLKSSPVDRQGFSEIGHDYLYSPDIIWGNTLGLGLISFLENTACFLLILFAVARLAEFKKKANSQISSQLSIWLCVVLYISMPMQFFQSSITKNDIAIVYLSLCLALLVYTSLQRVSRYNISYNGMKSSGDYHLFILLACVELIGCKSYGVMPLASISVTGIFFLITIRKNEIMQWTSQPELRDIQQIFLALFASLKQTIFNIWARGTMGYGFVGFLLIYTFSLLYFYIHRDIYWAQEYASSSKQWTTVSGSSNSALSFVNNAARGLVDVTFSSLNFPWPSRSYFHIPLRGTHLVQLLDNGIGLPTAGVKHYELTGNCSQDQCWPGLPFNIALFATTSFLLVKLRTYFTSPRKSFSAIVLPGFDTFLAIVSCLNFALISFIIFWQPWLSRFYGIVLILAIPLLSSVVAYSFRGLSFRLLFSIIIAFSFLQASYAIQTQADLLKAYLSNSEAGFNLATNGKGGETLKVMESHLFPTYTNKPIYVCAGGDTWMLPVSIRLIRSGASNVHFPKTGDCTSLKVQYSNYKSKSNDSHSEDVTGKSVLVDIGANGVAISDMK